MYILEPEDAESLARVEDLNRRDVKRVFVE
jgi:hypothetical protein